MEDQVDHVVDDFLTRAQAMLNAGQPATRRKLTHAVIQLQRILSDR